MVCKLIKKILQNFTLGSKEASLCAKMERLIWEVCTVH